MRNKIILIVLIASVIYPANAFGAGVSPYQSFGGKVEEYKPVSDAACVKNSCDKINEPIRSAIKNAISGPVGGLCAGVASACTIIPVVGNAACYAACYKLVTDAVAGTVNICSVEEMRVGPPKPALVGILNLGVIKVSIDVPIPFLPDIHITDIKINLVNLIPGVGDIVPDAKIYDFKDYETEGVWVLGNSLNLVKLCGGGNSDNPLAKKICDNPITQAMTGALGGISGGDVASCPLLNLLNKVGTSKASLVPPLPLP